MAEQQGKLIEVFQLGEERAGILDLPVKAWPELGQYLPCQNLSRGAAVLPSNLFRVIGPGGKLSVGPLPEDWSPGDDLVYLSPQGHGFHLPASARRMGLMPVGVSPARLLTLVDPALAQDAAVTLFYTPTASDDIFPWLPSAVEVRPITALTESLDWLDFLALEVNLPDLAVLSPLLGDAPLPFTGQVLVRTPMPCRGLGECGVCAVKTRQGLKLACQDGPVFPLEEVFRVA